VDDQVYTAPTGFSITGFNDLVREASNGSTSVTIAPGNKTLTVHAEATSRVCFEDSGVCVDCPDEVDKVLGSARRQVQVNLRSDEPTIKVDTRQELLITTRGLCCCPEGPEKPKPSIIGVWAIPADLTARYPYLQQRQVPTSQAGTETESGPETGPAVDLGAFPATTGTMAGTYAVGTGAMASRYGMAKALRTSRQWPYAEAAASSTGAPCACGGGGGTPRQAAEWPAALAAPAAPAPAERQMSIRQANAIIDFVRERMVKTYGDPRGQVRKRFVETDIFLRQLESYVRRSRTGREVVSNPAGDRVPDAVLKSVAKRFGKKPAEVTAAEILRLRSDEYQRLGVKPQQVTEAKLRLLGVKLRERPPRAPERDKNR
jgi:hypothetical protein